MIREFKKEDIYNIDIETLNNPILKDERNIKVLAEHKGLTYEDKGSIISILLYDEDYDNNTLQGMLVLSKEFKRHIKYYKHTKELIKHLVNKTKAKIMYTISISNETLDRWHRFLDLKRLKNIIAFNEPHTIWFMERRD